MGVTGRKAAAFAAALAMLVSGLQIPALPQTPYAITAQAADTGARIRVDINKNDGRKASYSKNANNWLLEEGTSPFYKVGNVTFKLSNGGSAGGNVTGANNKKLQLQNGI